MIKQVQRSSLLNISASEDEQKEMQTHVGPPILCDATQNPRLFAAPVFQLPVSLYTFQTYTEPSPVTSLLLVESSSRGFPQVNTRTDYAQSAAAGG